MIVKASEESVTAGKYLTFNLADESYGLEILRVQELVGLSAITRVPRLPAFIAGVINLRGRVIPLVDLRLCFGMAGSAMDDRTCVIVVRVERGKDHAAAMGVLVDEVSDVVYLAQDSIEPTPEFGTTVDTSFVKGVGRLEDRVVLLLDIDRVLSSSELDAIAQAAGHTGDAAAAQEPDSEKNAN